MAKDKNAKLLRLIDWIDQYPGFWQMACDPNNEHMNMSKMRTIVGLLAQAKLYEVIVVVLAVHKNQGFIESLKQEMLLEMAKKQIKDDNKDKMIKFILDKLE